ncbi:hypothetical protein B0J13DRAFT_554112 [Dactylonectria estremocensis]|uniref:NADH:flavin oxidoreductase/NADH oxidase N-terminal domain-containing protein n=1 Tax=Dactylonectria estremocensis TaxID=1079267 RepID=A0A9P9EVH9_9HYPO|nr:hypothetical protein B0J13DRAFT_554112 [Dactylonectria estremocensis]
MSETQSNKLFAPMKVGALDLQHRVVMAPLTRNRASAGTAIPADFTLDYYGQRASPGGLLISEGTFIAEEAGGYKHVPGIYSSDQIKAWKPITDAVHAKGGYIFCQLWALGRVADSNMVPIVWSAGSKPFVTKGPHPMRSDDSSLVKLTVMKEADIDRFVGHYRQAALNAVEAGFDGVEIHGANDYLVDQFLQSSSNDRTDSYGGSVQNRLRFPLRVLNAVCDAIGPERVGIRMSPFSFFQGMGEENPLALFVPWAETITKAQPSLAFVHAVGPRALGSRDTPEHLQKSDDCLVVIRDVVTKAGVKLIVAGGFLPETAIQHASETGDLVAFGRYFISNPDLPARIENGWPLRKYDRTTFYTQTREGYTDLSAYNARL